MCALGLGLALVLSVINTTVSIAVMIYVDSRVVAMSVCLLSLTIILVGAGLVIKPALGDLNCTCS